MTTLAHELKLEHEEVGQKPRWLHGWSSWLGDTLTLGRLGRELAMNGSKRSSGNQKFHLRLSKMVCLFLHIRH